MATASKKNIPKSSGGISNECNYSFLVVKGPRGKKKLKISADLETQSIAGEKQKNRLLLCGRGKINIGK